MAGGAGTLSHGTNAAHAREAGEKGLDGRSLRGCVVVFHVGHYTLLSSRCKPKLEGIWGCKCLWDKELADSVIIVYDSIQTLDLKPLLFPLLILLKNESPKLSVLLLKVSEAIHQYVICHLHVGHYTILSTIHLALLEGNYRCKCLSIKELRQIARRST